MVVLAQIFISDIVRIFTFCAKARKMWDLTRELRYHKAEEEGTEDWNKKKKPQVALLQQKMCPMPCISNASIIR